MRVSLTLIDKARSLCTPPTYYQLAKRLDINTATLSRCLNRGGTLDNEAASKLAALLEQDPYDVIAIMEMERAKDPKKRAYWESKLPRLMPVVAALAVITGVTHVSNRVVSRAPSHFDALYIMRSALRRWRPSLTACSSFA